MSYLALLSGMAEGAGGEFSKQGEEKRQSKITNDRLLADSINKRLEIDDTLDWPSYSNLRSQEYKLRGMDPKSIQGMLQHEQPLWQRHQQLTQSGLQTDPKGGYTAPTGQATQNPDGTTSTNLAMPSVPQQAQQLPEVPQAPVTSGSRKAEAAAQAQGVMDQQALVKQRGMNELTLEQQKRQLDVLNGVQGGSGGQPQSFPLNGSVETTPTVRMRRKTGLAANGQITESQEPEQPKLVPGLVYGSEVLKDFPNAQGVDATGWYKKGRFDNGEIVHYPGQPNTHAIVLYDPESPTHATEFQQDPRGNLITGSAQKGVKAPPNWSEKDTERESVVWKTDPNTGELKPFKVRATTATPAQITKPGEITPSSPVPSKPTLVASPKAPTLDKVRNTPQVRPFDQSDPIDNVIRMSASDSQLGDKEFKKLSKPQQLRYEQRLADLGVTPNNVTNSIRERAILARGVLSHLQTINGLLDQAQNDGDLGTIAKSWNEFLTNGKVGTDTTKNQVFAQLSSNYGFLTTAAAMAHGGLRGGSSPSMVEHWEHTLDAKDPDTMRAKLKSLEKWMNTYSNMVPGPEAIVPGGGRGGITPATPVPAATGTPKTAEDYLKSIGH